MTDQKPAQEQSPAPPQNTGSGEQGSGTPAGASQGSPVTPTGEGAVSVQSTTMAGGSAAADPGFIQEIQHLRKRAQEAEQRAKAFENQSRQYESALGELSPLLSEAQGEIANLSMKASNAEVEAKKAEVALKMLRQKASEFGFEVDESQIREAERAHADAVREQRLLQQQANLLAQARKEWRDELLQSQQMWVQQQQAQSAQQAFSTEVDAALTQAGVSPQSAQYLKDMAKAYWESSGRSKSAQELMGPILSNFRVQQAAQQAAQQVTVQQHPPTQQGPSGSTMAGNPAQVVSIKDAPDEIRNSGDMQKMMGWLKQARANQGQG